MVNENGEIKNIAEPGLTHGTRQTKFHVPGTLSDISSNGNRLLTLFKDGHFKELIADAAKLRSDDALPVQHYTTLALAYVKVGDLRSAIEVLKEVLVFNPVNETALNNLAIVKLELGDLPEAQHYLTLAMEKNPENPKTHKVQAEIYDKQGQVEQAIKSMKNCIELNQDNANAWNDLGLLYAKIEDWYSARHSYLRALRLDTSSELPFFNLGNLYRRQYKINKAIINYKMAIKRKPKFYDAHCNLATLYSELGDCDKAINVLKFILENKPKHAVAHKHLSSEIRYTSSSSHLVELQALDRDRSMSSDDQCLIKFALAKAYEDAGFTEQAFTKYNEANALKKKQLGYNIGIDKNLFLKLKDDQRYFDTIALKLDEAKVGPTPIFIVGMPRSGTTLVEQIVTMSNEVGGGGELDIVSKAYFSTFRHREKITTAELKNFRKKYKVMASQLLQGQPYITDKMPHNFRFIPLLVAAFPEASIIHVRRDKAATCWSNFKQFYSGSGLGYSYDLQDTNDYYEMYKTIMRSWKKAYHKIYEVDYDTLTIAQSKTTRNLIKHLGLKWSPRFLQPEENKRLVTTVSKSQVRKKIYTGSSDRWQKFGPYLNSVFNEK